MFVRQETIRPDIVYDGKDKVKENESIHCRLYLLLRCVLARTVDHLNGKIVRVPLFVSAFMRLCKSLLATRYQTR